MKDMEKAFEKKIKDELHYLSKKIEDELRYLIFKKTNIFIELFLHLENKTSYFKNSNVQHIMQLIQNNFIYINEDIKEKIKELYDKILILFQENPYNFCFNYVNYFEKFIDINFCKPFQENFYYLTNSYKLYNEFAYFNELQTYESESKILIYDVTKDKFIEPDYIDLLTEKENYNYITIDENKTVSIHIQDYDLVKNALQRFMNEKYT